MRKTFHSNFLKPDFTCCAVATGILLLCLSTGCALTSKKAARTLMPTPLGMSLGMPHPGGDFKASCSCTEEDVPVFIVSGRNVVDENNTEDPFGTERARIPRLGKAYVKIGANLTAEELHAETVSDRKNKKAKVEFGRTELFPPLTRLNQWLVKDNVVRHSDSPWVQELRNQLDQSGSRKVCIFVHGYNTNFVDNTLLAAEIFHYMGRQGAMLSFEWPSEARLLGYIADKGNATYSTRHFRGLLSNLAKECDVESITIIAHSAGSPIVVNALKELRLLEYELPPEQLRSKYRIQRVVLAAPDMDLMAFTNAIHDRFYEMAAGVAVYASPKDRALKLSQTLYNNKRLGRSVGRLEPFEKQLLGSKSEIEMIDASMADKQYKSFLGHSYFHRDPWVSSDIGAFIMGRPPQERGLEREEDGVFWRFPTDYRERLQRRVESMGFGATGH